MAPSITVTLRVNDFREMRLTVGDAVRDTTLKLSTVLQNMTITFDSVYAIVRGTDLHSVQLAVPSSSGVFVARNYSNR
jgi:hypothetical protein